MTEAAAGREILRKLVVFGTDLRTRYGHRLSADELAAVDARVAAIPPRAPAALGKEPA